MMDWRKTVVAAEAKLLEAISSINESAIQIALVLDESGRLAGTLTDGDIRRAILRGQLDSKVGQIMNASPTTASHLSSREHLLAIMRKHMYHYIPLVDESNKVVGLASLDELTGAMPQDNWTVLMAGGLGTRLGHLTENCPKPMLNVGGKPILETIIETLAEQGLRRFYLSVNYKAEKIIDYFEDGQKLGVEIRYLHEHKRLGTAGALSLLPERPTLPFLVMNGDLLTKLDFKSFLQFHQRHQSVATMAVHAHEYQVPYGVVQMNDIWIQGITEKPSYSHFVSAGIYAFSPSALDSVPKDEYFDMPSLYQNLIDRQQRVAAYPMKEYWLDIGRLKDFERAQDEYGAEFR